MRPQRTFGKFTQFAPAFANQGDHDDIRFHMLGKSRQQRGLSDARPRKEADPLAAHQWQERIENSRSRCQAGAETPAFGGSGRWRPQRPGLRATEKRATVKRLAVGIQDPSDPAVIRCNPGFSQHFNKITDPRALG
ncbi:hypothetical protein GCM10011452_12260 [Gemmobacter lanyuensis]|uniref:Uncharacterized protein n=1 Tax=Gemmobacter lanyuensis TaxID=1054497 RepID=A0A918ISK8_9RHOB|nr:hypothetical protein GCM10011452_12260 [Gemmobacter lanyuensis]